MNIHIFLNLPREMHGTARSMQHPCMIYWRQGLDQRRVCKNWNKFPYAHVSGFQRAATYVSINTDCTYMYVYHISQHKLRIGAIHTVKIRDTNKWLYTCVHAHWIMHKVFRYSYIHTIQILHLLGKVWILKGGYARINGFFFFLVGTRPSFGAYFNTLRWREERAARFFFFERIRATREKFS